MRVNNRLTPTSHAMNNINVNLNIFDGDTYEEALSGRKGSNGKNSVKNINKNLKEEL